MFMWSAQLFIHQYTLHKMLVAETVLYDHGTTTAKTFTNLNGGKSSGTVIWFNKKGNEEWESVIKIKYRKNISSLTFLNLRPLFCNFIQIEELILS